MNTNSSHTEPSQSGGRLHQYLGSVARRLLIVRCVEALVVSLAILLSAAIVAEISFIIFGGWPVWSLVLLAAALLVAAFALGRGALAGFAVPVKIIDWARSIYGGAIDRDSKMSVSVAALRRRSLMCVIAVSLAAVAIMLSPWRLVTGHWVIAAASALIAVVAAVWTVAARGVSRYDAAIWLDLKCNLGERITTAYELECAGSDGYLTPAVQQAARAAIDQYSPHRSSFWQLAGPTWVNAIVVMALAAALGFVSPLDSQQRQRKERRDAAIDQLAEQLQSDAARLELEKSASAEFQQHRDQLRELSESMRWGKMTPEQAASEINRMEQRLRESVESADAFDSLADRLSAMSQAAEAAGEDDSPETQALEAFKNGDMDSLGDELGRSMRAGGFSQADSDKWSEAMQAAADAASGDKELSDALKRAGEAAAQMDADAFSQAMADADKAADAAAQRSSDRQSLEAAADALANRRDQLVDSAQNSGNSGGGSGNGSGDMADSNGGSGGGSGGFSSEDFAQAADRAGGGNGSGAGSGDGGDGSGGGQGSGGQGGGQQGSGDGQSGAQANSGQGPGSQGGQGSQGGNGGNGGSASGASARASGSGGTTNRDSGTGDFGIGGGDDPAGVAKGRWARIYDPRQIEHSGEKVRPTGQVDPNAPPVERGEFLAPTGRGASYVPFDKAWQSQKKTTESDISSQRIPARLRKLVRDYYDSQ